MIPRLDRNALRFNQAAIIALTLLAFVLGQPVGQGIVVGVATVMLLGTLYAPLSGFKLFYWRVVVRTGLIRPRVVVEDPAPHQFAQGVGSVFLFAAFVALLLGASVVGWALAWVVIALAAVNLLFDFCAGCFLYFQLGRLGLWSKTEGAR